MYDGDLISRREVVAKLEKCGCPENYIDVVRDAYVAFDPEFLEYQIKNSCTGKIHLNVIKISRVLWLIKRKGLIGNDNSFR